MGKQAAAVKRLEDHPNLPEIVGVLAQLPHVDDSALPLLAQAWVNSPALAVARAQALDPDSPLVLEALAAFEAVTALFADDLLGAAGYLTVTRDVTRLALKAVRDAIAAAYAQPVLTHRDHHALLRPWRLVYPVSIEGPDLGPHADEIKSLLASLPTLGERCHDAHGQEVFDALLDRSFVAEADRAAALASAFDAAVLTQRRRVWALVRRTGAQVLTRPCPTCRARALNGRELERVTALCLDAACALLVADALPDADTELLTAPISVLVPAQRRGGPSS